MPTDHRAVLARIKRFDQLVAYLRDENRRADRARRRAAEPRSVKAKAPRPARRCKRCGGELPHRDRVYGDDCLPHYRRDQYASFAAAGITAMAKKRRNGSDPSHGREVGKRRGLTMARRRRDLSEWSGEAADPAVFERGILPAIQHVPLRTLMDATGLSLPYVS